PAGIRRLANDGDARRVAPPADGIEAERRRLPDPEAGEPGRWRDYLEADAPRLGDLQQHAARLRGVALVGRAAADHAGDRGRDGEVTAARFGLSQGALRLPALGLG